ncbi:TPA: hypothetical protein HA259_08895 [Thermoplasmata archaeon]|nr:hypothetical protein [Thermoplasmata archaeon]
MHGDGLGDGPSAVPVWTIEVERGDAKDVMDSIISRAAESGATVLVLDGRMVFGSDHVASAAFHARRAIAEGRNASDSLLMETLLYASGERQLSSAIGKMSVSESTTCVALALLSGERFDPGEDWREMNRKPSEPDLESLRRFGVGAEEMTTVGPERASELVLERVAAVDIIKK